MEAQKFTSPMSDAMSAIHHPRVQEIIEELARYNLGVALPHIHQNGVANLLPADKIQYEDNLTVSFVEKEEFSGKASTGYPVGWRWNNEENHSEACAWCHSDE